MALNKSLPTARLALAVALSTLLAACASSAPNGPLIASQPEIVDRFDRNGLTGEVSPDIGPRAFIDPANLRNDAPTEYTVVRGDTLWAISGRYLNKPWLWTELWDSNQHIKNPHLIYPGDKLELQYINGNPTILLSQQRAGGPPLGAANGEPELDENGNPMALYSNARIKISPTVRAESLDEAIPTIAGDSIQQFLVHPLVADARTINNAPYVVANDENRLVSSIGTQIYVRGKVNNIQTRYGVYRKNTELFDPENGRSLGFELTHVADAKLMNRGDPSTLMITGNQMETINGDILLASTMDDATHQYFPRLPRLNGNGRVVSLVDAISQTGKDQVVVLNMGDSSNIQAGDVLAIESRGRKIIDERSSSYDTIQLPNVRTGVVMVFKTFENVSYALVMESTRPISVNDIITDI